MNDRNTFGEYQRPSMPYPRVQGQTPFPTNQYPYAPTQEMLAQRQQPTRTQPRKAPARMPKNVALAVLQKMKQGIVVASILSFGTFSALAMSHTLATTQQATATTASKTATVTSTTKKTTTATSTATTTKTATATATKTATATPTTTATTTQQGGGYGFGSSSSSSQPVSGTHTS